MTAPAPSRTKQTQSKQNHNRNEPNHRSRTHDHTMVSVKSKSAPKRTRGYFKSAPILRVPIKSGRGPGSFPAFGNRIGPEKPAHRSSPIVRSRVRVETGWGPRVRQRSPIPASWVERKCPPRSQLRWSDPYWAQHARSSRSSRSAPTFSLLRDRSSTRPVWARKGPNRPPQSSGQARVGSGHIPDRGVLAIGLLQQQSSGGPVGVCIKTFGSLDGYFTTGETKDL